MNSEPKFCKWLRRFKDCPPEHRAVIVAAFLYPVAFVLYAIEKRMRSLPMCVFGVTLLALHIWVIATTGLPWTDHLEFNLMAVLYFGTVGPYPIYKKSVKLGDFNLRALIFIDITFAILLSKEFVRFLPIDPILLPITKGNWEPFRNHWMLISSIVLEIWVLIAINFFSYYNNFIKKKRV